MRAAPVLVLLGLWTPVSGAQDYVGEHLPGRAKPPASGDLPAGLDPYANRVGGKPSPAFDRLVDEAIPTLLALDPVHATRLGFHQYDALLPEADSAAVEARKDTLARLEDRVRAIKASTLDPARRKDHALVLRAIVLARIWGDDPVDYVETASQGIRSLLIPFAPLEERASNVIARLNAIAPLLRDARVRLADVQMTGTDLISAMELSRDLAEFLSNRLPVEMMDVKDRTLREEFDHHLAQAAGGAADFHAWLATREGARQELRIEAIDDPLGRLVGAPGRP